MMQLVCSSKDIVRIVMMAFYVAGVMFLVEAIAF